MTFKIQTKGEGSVRQLVVKASEAGHTFPVIKSELMGSISGSEVDDLNSDGRPELFLYVTSAGSGSYGSVMAWSASKAHTLLPITMQELSGKWAEGYMRHDQFAVVETTLMRRARVSPWRQQCQTHGRHPTNQLQARSRGSRIPAQACGGDQL